MSNRLTLTNENMRQIIGITKVKDPYKFISLLKKYHPNISNNEFDELIFNINNNNFVWYIHCKENEIRSISEYCDLFIKSSRYMKQNQFEFKPFDQVLVRDSNLARWRADFYSHLDNNNNYVCISGVWNYCIPYNEKTAHLIGTTKAYTPPQPKTYKVIFITQNGDRHQVLYTDNEFKKFIETTVLNNKDVSNFDVRRICG